MNFESKKSQEMMNHSSIGEIFDIEPQGGGGSPGGIGPGTVPARRARKRRFQKGGPLQSAISRIYAMGKPEKLKKCAMLLSSRIDGIYEGIMEIHKITTKIMGVEDIGVITSVGEQNSISERRKEMLEYGLVSEKFNEGRIREKLDEIREFGRKL